MSVEAPGLDPIILDLGTGLRFFGESLAAEEPLRVALALVTHLHWDHTQGLPFFTPVNRVGASLDVHAPKQSSGSVAEMFDEFMRPPYFPVRVSDLRGDITFHDTSNTGLEWGRAHITVRDVPHVGETNGYRIEVDGMVIVYISDHQQPVDGDDVAESVLELCRDADLLIHDAQYEPAEFAQKSDWGHCTIGYAVRVAAQSNAKRLVLFHHDPSHTDDDIERILGTARALGAEHGVGEVIAAAEGLTIGLGAGVDAALAEATAALQASAH